MQVIKRNGDQVPYEQEKIAEAINKALCSIKDPIDPNIIPGVSNALAKQVRHRIGNRTHVDIETIQNLAEEVLMSSDHHQAAKNYIIYREKQTEIREKNHVTSTKILDKVTSELQALAVKSSSYFDNDPLREFVYIRTYSRWIAELGRREMWPETVDRLMNFIKNKCGDKLPQKVYDDIQESVLKMEVMSSMRLMQFAGPAAERCNVCIYNCAFSAPETFKDLADIFYLSCSGTGVGFSCESRYVNKFPPFEAKEKKGVVFEYEVGDTKEGWCDSLQFCLEKIFEGAKVDFDYSKIRPNGARLMTSGGRASGPGPLKELHCFIYDMIKTRRSEGKTRLSTLDVHDIICKIGSCAMAGGQRRCIAKGQKVITGADSFKNIEEIQVGDHVLTDGGWKPVLKTVVQGEQEIIEIRHQEGVLRCTPNHRVAIVETIDSAPIWKEAKDLKEGDTLAYPIPGGSDSNLTLNIGVNRMPDFKYIKPPHSTTCKDIVIPPLDEKMAWFIGNFQGDGCVRITSKSGQLSVAIHADEIPIKDLVEEQFKRFGINTSLIKPKKSDNCFKVEVKSKQLGVYMHTHVKQSKTTLRVPIFIKIASPQIKVAFVQGLMDADGSIKNRPVTIVTTVYKEYAFEIQALLMSVGIVTRVKQPKKPKEENWQQKYNVVIINNRDKNLFNHFSPIFGYKKIPVKDKVQNANGWMKSQILFSENFPKPENWNQKVAPGTKDCNVPIDSLSNYFGITSKFIPIKVKEVFSNGEILPTYDIEVQDNHNFVCSGVLVHNSALISISDLEDDKMRDCKNGEIWLNNAQRYLANNSAAYRVKPSQIKLMEECLSLAKGGTGERGIVNTSTVDEFLPDRRVKHLGKEKTINLGCNPCVPGDTWVQTAWGPRQVWELVGIKTYLCVNGYAHITESNGFFETGIKQIYEVKTKKGFILKLTDNHKLLSYEKVKTKKVIQTWKELKDFKLGDNISFSNHRSGNIWAGTGGTFEEGWLIGQIVGDGGIIKSTSDTKNHMAYVRFWGETSEMMANIAFSYTTAFVEHRSDLGIVYNKQNKCHQILCVGLYKLCEKYGITLEKNFTEITERTSSSFQCGLIRGFFDADGSVQGTNKTGYSLRLAQSNLPRLQVVQSMLARLGIISTIYEERRPAGMNLLPDSNRELKEYYCQAKHELIIAKDNIVWYMSLIGFHEPAKTKKAIDNINNRIAPQKKEYFWDSIVSITKLGQEKVYDVTVADVHEFCANGIRAHNCGEVLLQPFQFCNLTEVVCRPDDTEQTLMKKISIATIMGTIQSSCSDFNYIKADWKKNQDAERLLGVSLTGIMDCPILNEEGILTRLKEHTIAVNKEYASMLGINTSNAITTTKPSGSVSQMVNSSSGIHPRFAPYYIRRIRISNTDPLLDFMKSQGFEAYTAPEASNTSVLEFPVKSPKGAITVDNVDAIQQLEHWKRFKTEYTEHNVSISVYVKPDEWLKVTNWIWDNWDVVLGISFFPKSDHVYSMAPYEEISQKEYEERLSKLQHPNFAELVNFEHEDATEVRKTLACAGGVCEL